MWEFLRTIGAVIAGAVLSHWLTVSRDREKGLKEKRLASYSAFIQAVVKEWDRLHMQAGQHVSLSGVHDSAVMIRDQRHENRVDILQSMVAVAMVEPDPRMRERIAALAGKVGSFSPRSFIGVTNKKDHQQLDEIRDEVSQLIKLVGSEGDDATAALWRSASQAMVDSIAD